MDLFSIFKRKKPLWETNFEIFAEQAGEIELDEYVKTLSQGREIDFTSSGWGHSYNADRQIGDLIHFGSGFYGGIIGSKKITKGDFLLLKTASNKVGKYLVLKIDYCRDPNDMFWAYIVCTGYKEQF